MSLTSDSSKAYDKARALKQRQEAAFMRAMLYAGEVAVKTGRSNNKPAHPSAPKGDYKDRTANLRNSVGYVVMKDGRIEMQAGDTKAIELAAGAARRLKGRYRLVVVASRNYASHVANRGYDVLFSAEAEALKELHRTLDNLNLR